MAETKNNARLQLSERIKKIREELEISQEELASRMGVSRPIISNMESGERKICSDELVKLAHIFNISVDWLLDDGKAPKVSFEKKKTQKQETGIRINVPQKNLEKFRETLLYILNKVGSRSNIGETVIYKLLYFIDFDFYEKYEKQFIGATYIKNHYGPTPVEFKKIIDAMLKEGEIERISSNYFQYPQTKYLPRREPDVSKLLGNELKMIDDVIDRLGEMNASQISDYSHGDVPWLTTEDGQKIEYEKVFYRTSAYTLRAD